MQIKIDPNTHWEHSKKDISESFPDYHSLIEENELAFKTISLVSIHRFTSMASIDIMKNGEPTHDKQEIVDYLDSFGDEIEKALGMNLDAEEGNGVDHSGDN